MQDSTSVISEAISLHVERWKNQLRAKSFSTLRKSLEIDLKIVKFRDYNVQLTRYVECNEDGSLNIVIRAYISPYAISRVSSFRAFTKYEDDSWTENLTEDAYKSLRAKIESTVPMI